VKRKAWKEWTNTLKENTYALYLVSRDPRVSPAAKIVIGAVVAYALSPIDLIPDFIPIIGYLDDLLILSLGIWIAIRLVPQDVWRECRESARQRISELPENRWAAVAIVTIWILALLGLTLWIVSFTNNTW
jgi:uncharacterized membrane protein YkvA (DUF1232 family)